MIPEAPSRRVFVALASPMRRRVLEALDSGPKGETEIGRAAGLGVNSVRFVLASFVRDGLVVRVRPRVRRGSPQVYMLLRPALGGAINELLALADTSKDATDQDKGRSPYAPGDPDAQKFCQTEEFGRALEAVIDETERYLDGKRAQSLLPLGPAEEPPAQESGRAEEKQRAEKDVRFLKEVRKLCPDGKRITGLTFTPMVGGKRGKSVTLTKKTGENIDSLLRAEKAKRRARAS